MYRRVVKRLFDIVLSGMAIIVLAVPMLIVAIIIKIDSPGPALFKQKRIGIHKTHFTILKFRSMPTQVPKDLPTHQFNASSMLSKWQMFIRKTSIDELPQIFNIFAGQMSIIGPRPALWNQEDLIAERDKYGANDVIPGLTGWAQVNGRDELEIADKAQLDGAYVQHISFKMDWTCFCMTVGNVLRHRGVIEGGTGVMARQLEKRESKISSALNAGTDASKQDASVNE